ncbi:MAG: Smr/MutS family protein [Bdellovibrionaceae bacterium]|nr:Smr/MutS family protein [Bdellovibrionales bacterium]MCB9083139.1 Smr/MutS family protein [Pseudobdellovibrionaceae bacterium]
MAGRAKNKNTGKAKGKTLDLHGRTTDEVFDLVDAFLLKESQRGAHTARIMTGKGKGLVQKVVIDYLRKAHYHWSHERLADGRPNEGVLVIHLE